MHGNAVGRELDPAGSRVANLARLQARQVVGDDLRDHRDHAIGQVDARAAVPRLLIERRALADKVRDVGDVYPEQPVATLDPLQRDRVVEVAGVDRVDRHDHAVGEIAAAGRDRLVEAVGLGARVVEHLLGERSRQAELVDHRLRVDADVARLAEHLHHHTLAIAKVRGESHHLDDDLVLGVHAFCAGVADRDRPREHRAVDLHPALAGSLEVGADEPSGSPLDDLHDVAGEPGPAYVAVLRDSDADSVARDGVESGDRRDVNVGRPIAGGRVEWPHEAVAGCGAAKNAHDTIIAAASRRGRTGARSVVAVTISRHETGMPWTIGGDRQRNAWESVALGLQQGAQRREPWGARRSIAVCSGGCVLRRHERWRSIFGR